MKGEPKIIIEFREKKGKIVGGWRYNLGMCNYSSLYDKGQDIGFIIDDCRRYAERNGIDLSEVTWLYPFTDDEYVDDGMCMKCSRDMRSESLYNGIPEDDNATSIAGKLMNAARSVINRLAGR